MEVISQCCSGRVFLEHVSSRFSIMRTWARCWLLILIGFQNVRQQLAFARFLADRNSKPAGDKILDRLLDPRLKGGIETKKSLISKIEAIQVTSMKNDRSLELRPRNFLGCGGFGIVFSVTDARVAPEDTTFAMKIVKNKGYSKDTDGESMVVPNEVNRLLEVHDDDIASENIVKLHDFGTIGSFNFNIVDGEQHQGREEVSEQKYVFLLLEYCSAGDLKQKIQFGQDWTHSGSDNDEEKAKREIHVVKQIIMGVQQVHKKSTVHCDVKWANFLVSVNEPDQNGGIPRDHVYTNNPSNWRVLLADFGEAQKLESGIPLNKKRGTACYRAPEMYTEVPSYSKEADWWSVGIMIFQLLYKSEMKNSLVGYYEYNEPFMFGPAGLGLDAAKYRDPKVKDPKAAEDAEKFWETLDLNDYTIDSLLKQRIEQLQERYEEQCHSFQCELLPWSRWFDDLFMDVDEEKTCSRISELKTFLSRVREDLATTGDTEDPRAPLKKLVNSFLCDEGTRKLVAAANALELLEESHP